MSSKYETYNIYTSEHCCGLQKRKMTTLYSGDWAWFCSRFLPVQSKFFLTIVAFSCWELLGKSMVHTLSLKSAQNKLL